MRAPPILERERRLRFVAVVLWSAFLGAAAMLVAWIAVLETMPPGDTGFGMISRVFFVSWAVALVPAICAAMLAAPSQDSSNGH
jgi:hypothetical protein